MLLDSLLARAIAGDLRFASPFLPRGTMSQDSLEPSA
jgi:hypothetical protein